MYKKNYSNFVRSSDIDVKRWAKHISLTGDEAVQLYLEEIKDKKIQTVASKNNEFPQQTATRKRKQPLNEEHNISDKDLLRSAQNNDVKTLVRALDICPDKINILDEFGWSLLMIACQGNSIETVKELLQRGIDRSVRDKAGNSAHSLVIKNKNIILTNLLLKSNFESDYPIINKHIKDKHKEKYICSICNNNVFSDKEVHLSSTLHNINVSKGKKIPVSYTIPESNVGYQMMLRVGWDKDSGLGPDGTGKKYPIKTVQKIDRKGLGHKKKKQDLPGKSLEHTKNKIFIKNDYEKHKNMEIRFRRQFY